jgi:hypothetical protein
MNKDEVIKGIYEYLTINLPKDALNIIVENDIRVENFFAIHTGVYLKTLLVEKKINSFKFQHTIILDNPHRTHIDIIFSDINNEITYLELKHFSISQNRGQGRSLSFYTSDSEAGKKVGIIGDCEKLDNLRNRNEIIVNSNLVCCAFITPKPKQEEKKSMEDKVKNYDKLKGWKLIYPIDYNQQYDDLGILSFQK